MWVWNSVCRGFSILGGLGGFLVDFPVWSVVCFACFWLNQLGGDVGLLDRFCG